MAVAELLAIIFGAGVVGGAVNALLSDNGFLFPKYEDSQGARILRPGFLTNLFIGGVAACISWGLYGPLAAVYIAGGPVPVAGDAGPVYGVSLSALVGAVLVGVAGTRWLTNEVDKTLLRAAASEAATKQGNPAAAGQLATASPAGALTISRSLP